MERIEQMIPCHPLTQTCAKLRADPLIWFLSNIHARFRLRCHSIIAVRLLPPSEEHKTQARSRSGLPPGAWPVTIRPARKFPPLPPGRVI